MKELISIRVEIAKHSGYCFGVSRAMKMTENELNENNKETYAIGPIIHNEQAMLEFQKKHLIIQENLSKIKSNSSAIIRSHGLPKSYYMELENKGVNIVDATCPFVKKIQEIAVRESEEGRVVIIIGDRKHPEVIGISGWIDYPHIIISYIEEAVKFECSKDKSYSVVVQTTFNISNFAEIEKILSNKTDKIKFYNTICYATNQRQKSAEELSKKVDAMIVVGGKKSSNTKKLAEICEKNCKTFLIETKDELDEKMFIGLDFIGIVAGASTPDFIINEVYDYVNKINIKEFEFND